MSREPDDLLDQLAALPAAELDATVADSIRRRARAAFVRTAGYREVPWLGRLAGLYARVLEPSLAVGVTVAYLGWAMSKVAELYH
jgi:hypothetical protein